MSGPLAAGVQPAIDRWWSVPVEELYIRFSSSPGGLEEAVAAAGLESWGRNVVRPRQEQTRWRVLGRQLRSPLVLILVFAAIDNLWKGTSSQAVQNLNLMFGLEETEGLL